MRDAGLLIIRHDAELLQDLLHDADERRIVPAWSFAKRGGCRSADDGGGEKNKKNGCRKL
jgi:hypothetical protein